MTQEQVLAALNDLDVENDAHWNKNGSPKIMHLRDVLEAPSLSNADIARFMPVGHDSVREARAEGYVFRAYDPEQAHGILANTLAEEALADEDEDQPDAPDAIKLFEAAVAAAQTDRFRRNSALQALVGHYQAGQRAIREIQERLDTRMAKRHTPDERKKRADEGEIAS